ncbi:hypothetical protein EV401DRAFT_2081235 [Pisolithus croceorrhizus]|nr:hypothetical protein EV401DRAFT_2081235 [Pisolithus croceorrhizus]
MSRQFRFHPYARVKPSAREIVALYDDTYDEDHTIPSLSATSDSGMASVGRRLSSYKLSRQYRYHPYMRMKPSAHEIMTHCKHFTIILQKHAEKIEESDTLF